MSDRGLRRLERVFAESASRVHRDALLREGVRTGKSAEWAREIHEFPRGVVFLCWTNPNGLTHLARPALTLPTDNRGSPLLCMAHPRELTPQVAHPIRLQFAPSTDVGCPHCRAQADLLWGRGYTAKVFSPWRLHLGEQQASYWGLWCPAMWPRWIGDSALRDDC